MYVKLYAEKDANKILTDLMGDGKKEKRNILEQIYQLTMTEVREKHEHIILCVS